MVLIFIALFVAVLLQPRSKYIGNTLLVILTTFMLFKGQSGCQQYWQNRQSRINPRNSWEIQDEIFPGQDLEIMNCLWKSKTHDLLKMESSLITSRSYACHSYLTFLLMVHWLHFKFYLFRLINYEMSILLTNFTQKPPAERNGV